MVEGLVGGVVGGVVGGLVNGLPIRPTHLAIMPDQRHISSMSGGLVSSVLKCEAWSDVTSISNMEHVLAQAVAFKISQGCKEMKVSFKKWQATYILKMEEKNGAEEDEATIARIRGVVHEKSYEWLEEQCVKMKGMISDNLEISCDVTSDYEVEVHVSEIFLLTN